MAEHGYIKSLDGVRAFAIVLVMSLHTGIMHFGWVGVQLFFVLSGYLITGILWKEKNRVGPVGQKLKRFWVRRALRIFPLYFGYLFVLAVTYVVFHFPGSYGTYIPYLVTYTYNFTRGFPGWRIDPAFAHLWSLAIEEQFYLVFPLVLFLSSRRMLKVFMPVMIFAAPVIRLLLEGWLANRGYRGEQLATIVYWNTLSHVDAFFLGGLIPVFSLDKSIARPKRVLLGSLALAFVAGLWNYLYIPDRNFFLTDLGYSFGHTENYVFVWHYTVLNLLFASTILFLVSVRERTVFPRWRRLLESKWLVNIGRVSYGMYIYHWIVWYYLFEDLIKPRDAVVRALLFLPYLAIVYFVASLSYRYFEAWFIRLKDVFFPEGGGKGKAVAADAAVGVGIKTEVSGGRG
ncbi:MAG TPA: acyltransferase [Puia sp.]|jgi:peptidoglycan/LPS O-acetylase OafA/YrhL|nr:acyltransferase [Puia sp.]